MVDMGPKYMGEWQPGETLIPWAMKNPGKMFWVIDFDGTRRLGVEAIIDPDVDMVAYRSINGGVVSSSCIGVLFWQPLDSPMKPSPENIEVARKEQSTVMFRKFAKAKPDQIGELQTISAKLTKSLDVTHK